MGAGEAGIEGVVDAGVLVMSRCEIWRGTL